MRILDKNVDIDNPKEVWDFINQNYNDNGKRITWEYYKIYASNQNLNLQNLRFDWVKKIPFIPTEEMLDNIISTVKKEKIRNSLRILKFGVRINELKNVRFEHNRRVMIVRTEKRRDNAERIIPLPDWFTIPQEWETKPKPIQEAIKRATKKLAKIKNNPDYLKIHPHSFRHWFATDLYAKTKDIMLVKERLGHTEIKSTLVYVQLVQTGKPKYEVKKVDIEDVETIQQLVKTGWEIAIQTEKWIIFKKPMWI